MLPLKSWKILNTDYAKSVITVILENRQLTSEHLDDFRLSERLHDPFLLNDMEKAVARILEAVKNEEMIGIFGDYDVDGIVSTVLMLKFFEKIQYPNVHYFIPNRQRDGYGLKPQGIIDAREKGVKLLITVDNGISAHEAIELSRSEGLDVVVTDHHLQERELPPAVAVVNPNRQDSTYPFSGLCGAGVVYKLFQVLGPKFLNQDTYKAFMLDQLDLVALATIADIAPIRDENYAMVKFGLKSLTKTLRPGIVELKRVSGLLGKSITPISVGYYLAPRLNAAGRLGDAGLALKLLLSATREEANRYAIELNQLNSKRQQLQEQYISEAIESIGYEEDDNIPVYIVENEDWDPGIIGIISGKLKDRFYRPVLAFTRDYDGNYVGSGRSIEGFHITEALGRFSDLYVTYGGHQKAAGLTITPENYPRFKHDFLQYVNGTFNPADTLPVLTIDTVVRAGDLNDGLITSIQDIGPYGEDNPEPILVIEKVFVRDIFLLSEGKHLKFVVEQNGAKYECVWWNRGNLKDALAFGMQINVAFRPSINTWNCGRRIQLTVEDVHPL
jgi:single-stranded-DNA-specific exonuclease